ncbi:MAG: PAS domain S-box protein [Thermodesulfobacteriota bacterium]
MRDTEKSKAQLIAELNELRESESRYRDLHEESRMREELYRSLLNSSADAIVVYDMEGNAQYVNPSFARIFGWTLEDVQGTRIPYMPEEEREASMAIITELLERGTPCTGFQTRRLTKDGRYVDVSISASRYHDHHGNPLGMLAILRDISDAMHAQEELRKSREEYRALYVKSERLQKHYLTMLEDSPEPIVVYDVKGIPLYISPSFSRVFGWTFDELKGRPIDFVPPENWPETQEMINKVLNGEAFFGSETRRYTKSGNVIDVSVSGAVFFDEIGARTGSVVHLRDISPQKRAEAKLAAELKRFQALYDLALAMIAERSLEENISLVVDKVREILGVDKAFIALRDERTDELYMHTMSGIVTPEFKNVRIPLGVGLGGEVARTGKYCIVEDYFQEVGPAFHDVVRPEGFVSGMAVPVQIGDTNLGVLYAFNCSRTKFSRADLDSLSLLGNLAAVEITRKRVQERLRDREETLRALYEESKRREELYVSLLNSSADPIVIYDVEGRAQYVNPAFTRIFGWTADEVLGKTIPFLPDSEREATMAVIRGLLRDGTPCSAFETKRFTKDGRILDVSVSASRTLDHEGEIAGTLAILRNISDRKQAEAAIRESEERFRTLSEMAPFGLVVATGDERTEYVNPKFTEIFGYSLEDMPNANAWFGMAYPSASSSSKAAAVWRAEAAEIKRKYGIGREAEPRVFRAICKDGFEKVVSFRAVLLDEGRLIATFVDVTAEAKAQQEIVRAKNEWERTFNSVSDLIVILDQDLKVVRMNKALADRLGTAADELIGRDCRQSRTHETTLAALCPETGTLALGREHSAEVVDERLGGVFDLRVSPLTDEQGRLIGSVNVARDITAFKSLERARRRAVHHLSHELKTPLAVIKSTVKHLGRKDLSEGEKEERLDRIRRNLKRLTDIQETVQEIAAPRAYNPVPFALVSVVDGLLEQVSRRSAHRSVVVVPRLEPIETEIIDPQIFVDILHTLLKNAIENTPDEGEVLLHLTRVPTGVLLQVEDKGVGISASDKEFVFKAFYHTQPTSRYSTRNPFDFNAGGKGLELMRLKILSEECPLEITFQSRRCHYVRTHRYECPGRVSLCEYAQGIEDCRNSGGTTFSVLFS